MSLPFVLNKLKPRLGNISLRWWQAELVNFSERQAQVSLLTSSGLSSCMVVIDVVERVFPRHLCLCRRSMWTNCCKYTHEQNPKMAFQWIQPPLFNRGAVAKFHHTRLLGPELSAFQTPRESQRRNAAFLHTNPRECRGSSLLIVSGRSMKTLACKAPFETGQLPASHARPSSRLRPRGICRRI